jgi:lipopolysaccharide assembly outer membrane protein LptD (OstA)
MRIWLIPCFSVFFFSTSPAQISSRDSLTTRSDTSIVDTAKTPKDTTASSGVDTVVIYSCADSVVYEISTKTMSMYSSSDVKYRQMQLKAERIDVDWGTSRLTSFGIPDTSRAARHGSADSARSSDTTTAHKKKFKGLPIMRDGSEEYHGFRLGYNFKTKRGIIDVGETEIEKGYYHGEEIKKVDKDVLFVSDGRYTTCDADDPHFYFYSPEMKVTFQDLVIAEPVYLYIADVPVFALPFAVFPNKGGRRSGIIAPAYGDDPSRGKYLRHLGYYLALSNYMDWDFRSDLYTKGGYSVYSDYRYALRYNFTGSVSGEYKSLHTGEPSDPSRTETESYRLNLTHNQEIDPTTRLNVDFTLASNNSYINTIDLQQAFDQSIISNATISKSWEGTPNSMSVNISRRQNLVDGSISEVLPSLSFNHSQSYPFRRSKSPSDESSKLAWYEMIGVGYNINATNNQAKIDHKIDGIRVDTTFQTVDAFERDRSQSVSQNFSVSIAPKLGYFTIAPSLSYSDQRSFATNTLPQRSWRDSTLVDTTEVSTTRAGYLSSGISAGTKFYGIVQPNMFGVAAIRHTVTPSLSFTYQKQIVGDNFSPRQMYASLGVGNVFEMKMNPSDSGTAAKRIQLLNLGLGISYNFTADSLKFSELGTNFRTGIGSLLDIGGGANFNLYQRVETAPGQYTDINKFLFSEEHRLARLTNFNVSLSTSWSGEKSKSNKHQSFADTLAGNRPQSGTYGLYQEEEPDFSIPWKLSLSWDFGQTMVLPSPTHSSNMHGHLEFNLTENWKFVLDGAYDVLNKKVLTPDIKISRDLHCWLMDFEWVPIGTYRHFQFEIKVAAPQLRDIKVTKSGSGDRGIY